MISKEQFLTIKRLKQEGVPIAAIARRIGISEPTTRKWANMSEAGFDELKKDDIPYLDNYREFILSILRVCPQTRETNILYRLREEFPDFECRKTTFYKYMRKLREQTGFVQFTGRVTSLRDESPPGYEAQVDFGQYRMKDMYGKPVRVYFFCMVLAYSRMHYVYFSRDPFTTKIAIQAHEYAFQYFGGRTQMIVYDQDRVFVVDENFGNIVLVPKFEEYVKKVGFSVRLCRPHDPQSKGKVETFVRYIKESFLAGRIYKGIDSLNSHALRWLDAEGNGTTNLRTRKPPRVMFREEAQQLGLTHIASGKVDLGNETLSNTDYLKQIFEAEVQARESEALDRRRKASNLPHRIFTTGKLNKGVKWQIEQLEQLDWIEASEDIAIIGRCDTGKTSLAVHLGELALKGGYRVYYCNIDVFLQILRNKDTVDKYHRKFRYMISCDLIIIDELMYVALSEQDLPLFYRAVNFLKEERSIIYITNRELSEWPQVADDKHLMETLTQKIMSSSQQIRLQ